MKNAAAKNRVLIVDDDVVFNNLLTEVFEQADYEVSPSLDPREALQIFDSSEFSLVVTDQDMPNMTGAEFFRLVREKTEDVPVIMVSGYLDSDTTAVMAADAIGAVFLSRWILSRC